MKIIHKSLILLTLLALTCAVGFAQEVCPVRPAGGAIVPDPIQLTSQNGVLTVDLTMVTSLDVDGTTAYCFLYAGASQPTEAPTLVAKPGDVININLSNHLPVTAASAMGMHTMHMASEPAATDSASSDPAGPCQTVAMSASITNIHFHGLNIPPRCHQDEVIKTAVQPNDPTFQYSFQIPANEPPGLYWYHPHPHGMTLTQVAGGASGALIVSGIEKVRPEVAGLAQRVFVIRQKTLPSGGEGGFALSVNFVPAYTHLASTISMKPSERQFWRVVNSSSKSFIQLQLQSHGFAKQLQLVARDGVPLSKLQNVKTVLIPPAGRAEFIMQGPPRGTSEQFMDLGFDTGPGGDSNQESLLSNVLPTMTTAASAATTKVPAATQLETVKRFAGLSSAAPVATRRLYFSESPDGTQFFITVEGQKPKIYEPADPPAIVTNTGAVEDWIIENRSQEVHAFHIHQIHFLTLEQNGLPFPDPGVRDTITVPYWDGVSTTFPSIKVRMDFRDPEIAGTFLYHCHILDHEDGGMMAKIQVLPKN